MKKNKLILIVISIGLILTPILFYLESNSLSGLLGENQDYVQKIRSADDGFENNDNFLNAKNISGLTSPLFNLNQSDNDYYMIDIAPGNEEFTISIHFDHDSGNMDLTLYGPDQNWLAESDDSSPGSGFESEQIYIVLPTSGIHYILVDGVNAGNLYNMQWATDAPPLDPPSLISPANNLFTQTTIQNLHWTLVSGATVYHIQRDITPGFDTIPDDSTTETNFTTESLSDNTYYWRVRAYNAPLGEYSTYSPTWRFTVDTQAPEAPLPQTPSHDSTTNNNTTEMIWTVPSGTPNLYHLQISNESDFSPLTVNITTSSNTYITDPLPDGQYYWQIRARDAAGNWGPWSIPDRWFTIDTVGPDAPVRVTPTDGEYINKDYAYLDWEASLGAVSYQVIVTGIYDNTLSNTYLNLSGLAQITYEWRIRAQDSLGNWGPWSSTWNFTIDFTPPTYPPMLYTLANGTITNNNTPTFTWETLTEIDKYQIQFDDNEDFLSPVREVNVSEASYTLALALPDGTFYWRLRAHDLAGNPSNWGANWSFTIDTEIPNTPVFVWPKLNQELNMSNLIFFEWIGDVETGEFQLQMDDSDDFISPLLDIMVVGGNYTSNAFTDNTYYARIRCIDNAGNTGNWSDTVIFIMDFETEPPSGTENNIPGYELLFIIVSIFGVLFYKGKNFNKKNRV